MDKIAYIREAECIGCAKCISACSDKAILGARKLMHTILTDLCTGCEECIAPCPVDCIEMVPVSAIRASVIPATSSVIPATCSVIPATCREDDALTKKDLIAQAIQRTLQRRGWNNPS